jgi:hypothetical protein
MSDIVEMLRLRACPPEGEYLEHDHGHSDCYLEREAADEIEDLRFKIERLHNLIIQWADVEDKTEVHWTNEYAQASEALRNEVGI